MEALLADVPQDAIVLDPFLGSGTTALACLRTGHSAIGIEREEPFLRIATARARYWDKAHQGWKEAEIISDILEKEEEKAPLSLEALLGG
jgi:DNA modification methylase